MSGNDTGDKITLVRGRRYRGTIELGWWQSWAGNDTVAETFRGYGFTDVTVTGKGGLRVAEGTWAKPDTEIDRPAQVTKLEVIEA